MVLVSSSLVVILVKPLHQQSDH